MNVKPGSCVTCDARNMVSWCGPPFTDSHPVLQEAEGTPHILLQCDPVTQKRKDPVW